MGVPQKQVLTSIRENVVKIEPRYEAYHEDLLKAFVDVVEIQKSQPYDHVNRVEDRVRSLGELLARKTRD